MIEIRRGELQLENPVIEPKGNPFQVISELRHGDMGHGPDRIPRSNSHAGVAARGFRKPGGADDGAGFETHLVQQAMHGVHVVDDAGAIGAGESA
jgi:hypothetical protein